MKNVCKVVSVFILVNSLITIVSGANKLTEITPEIRAKIKAAIPTRYQKPATTRKVLVFSNSSGFVHSSTSVGNELLAQMSTATGAYTVVFNDNPATYTEKYLNGFDAILVNNATRIEKAFTGKQREYFLNFIKNGGAFIGIHSASDGGYDSWPEYSKMIGGLFAGHPWTADKHWAMVVNDTSHPINKPFTKAQFEFKDEIYCQSGPYKKACMHTLIKIDPKNDPLKITPEALEKITDKKKRRKAVVHDREYPISWIKDYGKGKVFYTCFGHNAETYYVPMIADHILSGIQYALGDLEAKMVLGK